MQETSQVRGNLPMTSTRDSVTGTMSAFALELELRVSLTAARHDQGSYSAIAASARGPGANGTPAAQRLCGQRTRRSPWSPPPHERPPVRTSTRIRSTVSPSFPYSVRSWNKALSLALLISSAVGSILTLKLIKVFLSPGIILLCINEFSINHSGR